MALKPHHEGQRGVIYSPKGRVFGPRDFDIVWGSDARYWRLPKNRDVRGLAVAELVKVSWLEVSTYCLLSPWMRESNPWMRESKCEISFSVSLKPDAFGWSDWPIYLLAKFGKKGKYIWRKIDLHQITSFPAKIPTEKFEIEIPTTRGGDDDDDDDRRLYFGLYEVWTGIAKGGLLIHNAKVELVH